MVGDTTEAAATLRNRRQDGETRLGTEPQNICSPLKTKEERMRRILQLGMQFTALFAAGASAPPRGVNAEIRMARDHDGWLSMAR
jgi:hypothetical protein